MKMSLVNMVYEFLKENKEKKITSRQIAEELSKKFEKKIRKRVKRLARWKYYHLIKFSIIVE